MTYLDDVEARAAAATPGPWDPLFGEAPSALCWFMDYGDGDEPGFDWPQTKADAAFIAAARQDVPRLVAFARAVLAAADKADPQERAFVRALAAEHLGES